MCDQRRVDHRGGKKREEEEEIEEYVRSERSNGRFCRAIPLPEGAEPDKAHAEFHDGVLTILIPRPVGKPKTAGIPVSQGRRQPS